MPTTSYANTSVDTELVGGPGDGLRVNSREQASHAWIHLDRYDRRTMYIYTRERTHDGLRIARTVNDLKRPLTPA